MANKLYDKGREAFGNAQINWISDDIIALLIDTDNYTVDLTTDQYLFDIPVIARVAGGTLATKVSLENCSNVSGVMSADDTTFPTVTGDICRVIVLCKRDTGDFENSLLIAYIDDAGGFPITPGGVDILIRWATTADKIFKL